MGRTGTQLPPLVVSDEAKAAGADVSLFKRLCEAHPAAVCDLTLQHRMAEDIMLLANRLVYSDRLKAATDAVAQSALQVRVG